MNKPLLSIGIIFKNDIRCLARCLESLTPLRAAIPCQLVMADTGSADGSRAVAEQYADILLDFPWVDDFAAARNVVLDRCTGEWCLTVDTDEWLDSDFGQLVDFLRGKKRGQYDMASIIQRNYQDKHLRAYGDFLPCAWDADAAASCVIRGRFMNISLTGTVKPEGVSLSRESFSTMMGILR